MNTLSIHRTLPSIEMWMSAAAGDGTGDLEESVAGYIAFTGQWIECHAPHPPLCAIISVKGDSMEPTLPDSSYILVDRRSSKPRHGRIYKEGDTNRVLQVAGPREDAAQAKCGPVFSADRSINSQPSLKTHPSRELTAAS